MLPEFKYYKANSISDAVRILQEGEEQAKILAGGTDLILALERGKVQVSTLVSLRGISELNGIRAEGSDIVIGANVTHREIEQSPLIAKELQALQEGAGRVGSVQIRNVATVAGNLCNGATSADTASPLLALGARVRVIGPKGEREIDLTQFYKGPGRTVLEPSEMLLEIIVPRKNQGTKSTYLKVSRRREMDLALMGVAVCFGYCEDNLTIADMKIAFNTVAPTPIRAYKTENMLKGNTLSEDLLAAAAETAVSEASPRSSWRSSASYRQEMIRVYLKRAISETAIRIKS